MKPKTLLLLIILLPLSLCPIFGQGLDSYDIGAYQPPDYRYCEFTIVPEISFNNIDSIYANASIHANNTQKSYVSDAYYSLASGLRFHRYTKRFELGSHNFMNASLASKPLSKTESDYWFYDSMTYDRGSNAAMIIGTADSGRMYYPSGAFIGALGKVELVVGKNAQYSGNVNKGKFDPPPNIAYNELNTSMQLINPSFSLFLGGGWGRIRDVTFAAVACAMLDRIREVAPQALAAGLNSDGIQDFASSIEIRKRQRSFDDRLSLINNIDALSQYLVDKKAIESPTSAIALELADQWMYAFAQNRQAGLEISCYPGITIDYSRNISSDKNYFWRDSIRYGLHLNDDDLKNAQKASTYLYSSNRTREYQTQLIYSINSTFRVERPANRFVQTGAQIDLNFHWNHYIAKSVPDQAYLGETDLKSMLPEFQAFLFLRFAYYPNTRTTLSFSPNVFYDRTFNYLFNDVTTHGSILDIVVENSAHNDFRGLQIGFPLQVLYYISPRLQYRISADAFLRKYYSSTEITENNWYSSYTLQAGLTYQLF